ncbi:MAG: putative capsular polysaccharide synthesis family protein [Flavobacteriaceae bacterium]
MIQLRFIGFFKTLILGFFVWVRFIPIRYKVKEELILILTPGKVGSSTIYKSVKHSVNTRVYHIHSINNEEIINSMKIHFFSPKGSVPRHLFTSYFLSKILRNYKGKVKLIILVREPVSRLISSVYQNLDMFGISPKYIDVEEVNEIILSKLNSDYFDYLDRWFNKEIKETFGIDVFADPEKSHFESNITGFCMKMEDIDDEFEINCRTILGINAIVRKENIAKDKPYNKEYIQSKRAIKNRINSLPLEGHYARRFYGKNAFSFISFGKAKPL